VKELQGKIVIFGFGSFGRHLYKHLKPSGKDVIVVVDKENYTHELDDEQIDIKKINIKQNEDILELGIDPKNDLVYCSMDKTAHNLFLVLSLKTLYRQINIIAISNSFENARKLKYAGATSVIDLYEATSRRFVHMLTKPAVMKAVDEIIYKENDLKMAEITLPKDSPIDKKYLSQLDFKAQGIVLIAIIDTERGRELSFVDHSIDHKLDSGDTLVVVAQKENLEKFKSFLERK